MILIDLFLESVFLRFSEKAKYEKSMNNKLNILCILTYKKESRNRFLEAFCFIKNKFFCLLSLF